MVEHVKLRALPIDGNDMSGAIRVAFASMPPEDQAALLTTLQAPAPPRLRWLEPPPLPRALPPHNSSGCEAVGSFRAADQYGWAQRGRPLATGPEIHLLLLRSIGSWASITLPAPENGRGRPGSEAAQTSVAGDRLNRSRRHKEGLLWARRPVSAPKLNGRYGSVSRPRRDAREWAKRADSGHSRAELGLGGSTIAVIRRR